MGLFLFATMAFSQTVYVAEKGKSCHLDTCRSYRKMINPIPMDLNEAIEKGYKPCKWCLEKEYCAICRSKGSNFITLSRGTLGPLCDSCYVEIK